MRRFGALSLVLSLFLLHIPLQSAAEDPFQRGVIEYRAENFEEAFEFFRQAREAYPESSVAAFYLGLTHKQMGDLPAAARELEAALSLTPPVKDAYLELAEVLFVMERLDEAKKWLAAAEEQGVKPGHTAFLKGLVLAREGKEREAVKAFTEAKRLNPSLAQASELQIALLFARDRRLGKARDSLKAVMTIDPTSELASFAREYEASLDRALALHDAWQFTVGAAYQYDDNVLTKPSTVTGIPAVDDITGEGDSSLVATFGVNYNPLLSGPWFLNGQYNLYSNTYAEIHSHNLITQSLSLIPGRYLKKGVASLPVTYNYLFLSEESYLSILSVKPALSLLLDGKDILQVSLGYARRNLVQAPLDQDEDRDSDLYNLLLGYARPFAGGKGIVNLRYEYTRDDTEGRNWNNSGHRASLSSLLPVWEKMSLTLAADYFRQNYLHRHTVFDRKRKDSIYSASAGLIRKIRADLDGNLQYSYTRSDSNVPIYDYYRNVVTVGIEYSF